MAFTGTPGTRLPVGFGPPRQESLYYESERLNRQSVHLDADEDASFYGPYLASMSVSMEHEHQHHEIMEQDQQQQHSQQESQHDPVDFMANPSMHFVQKGRPRLSVITNQQEDSGDESDHDDDSASIASATPGGQRYKCPWPKCPKASENGGFHMNRLK